MSHNVVLVTCTFSTYERASFSNTPQNRFIASLPLLLFPTLFLSSYTLFCIPHIQNVFSKSIVRRFWSILNSVVSHFESCIERAPPNCLRQKCTWRWIACGATTYHHSLLTRLFSYLYSYVVVLRKNQSFFIKCHSSQTILDIKQEIATCLQDDTLETRITAVLQYGKEIF